MSPTRQAQLSLATIQNRGVKDLSSPIYFWLSVLRPQNWKKEAALELPAGGPGPMAEGPRHMPSIQLSAPLLLKFLLHGHIAPLESEPSYLTEGTHRKSIFPRTNRTSFQIKVPASFQNFFKLMESKEKLV